jgi:hypothetical protein
MLQTGPTWQCASPTTWLPCQRQQRASFPNRRSTLSVHASRVTGRARCVQRTWLQLSRRTCLAPACSRLTALHVPAGVFPSAATRRPGCHGLCISADRLSLLFPPKVFAAVHSFRCDPQGPDGAIYIPLEQRPQAFVRYLVMEPDLQLALTHRNSLICMQRVPLRK